MGGRKNGHISIISKNKTIKTKNYMDRKSIEEESGEKWRETKTNKTVKRREERRRQESVERREEEVRRCEEEVRKRREKKGRAEGRSETAYEDNIT